jgi:hypothetical protein
MQRAKRASWDHSLAQERSIQSFRCPLRCGTAMILTGISVVKSLMAMLFPGSSTNGREVSSSSGLC